MLNEKRKGLIGRDDDNGGWLGIIIVLVVVAVVLAIIFYGGVFIGGFHALKNYIMSFYVNVIDDNKKPVPAA